MALLCTTNRSASKDNTSSSLFPPSVTKFSRPSCSNSISVTLGRRGNPSDFDAPTPNYEGYLNLIMMKLQPRFLVKALLHCLIFFRFFYNQLVVYLIFYLPFKLTVISILILLI
ncbi:hypothetical protein ABFX02_10G044400 [Erythranthe guttata]